MLIKERKPSLRKSRKKQKLIPRVIIEFKKFVIDFSKD